MGLSITGSRVEWILFHWQISRSVYNQNGMEQYLRKQLQGGVFKNVPLARSLAMSKVRGRGNRTTETRLRYALVRAGISGWELHANLPGRPDFYFRKQKFAIFVDGCFWHGCARCGHIPHTNKAFWVAKIERNQFRARRWNRQLRNLRISVLHIWECQLNRDLPNVMRRLTSKLYRRKQLRAA